MKTIYISVEYEYDFGGDLLGGRGNIFEVKDVKSVNGAKKRCLQYMKDNVEDFEEDLVYMAVFKHAKA